MCYDNMVNQNTFMETVKSVAEIMRVAEEPMSEKEILSYFDDMELNKEQQSVVLEYLLTPKAEETEESKETQVDNKELPVEEGSEGTDNQEIKGESEQEMSEKSPVFRMYLEEIEGIQNYSAEVEMKLYQALLEGDESVITKLSECWLLRVLESAKGYMTPRLNIEDLVQEGNMALFVELQKLCGAKDCEDVAEVLKNAVESGIMSYASEMTGLRDAEDAMLAKMSLVHEAKELLAEEKGKEPTMEQLAEYTKMTVNELSDLFELLEMQN